MPLSVPRPCKSMRSRWSMAPWLGHSARGGRTWLIWFRENPSSSVWKRIWTSWYWSRHLVVGSSRQHRRRWWWSWMKCAPKMSISTAKRSKCKLRWTIIESRQTEVIENESRFRMKGRECCAWMRMWWLAWFIITRIVTLRVWGETSSIIGETLQGIGGNQPSSLGGSCGSLWPSAHSMR